MRNIQIGLDESLLRALDEIARRTKRTRSAVIRDALRAGVARLDIERLEALDQAGYARAPSRPDEFLPWENECIWPDESPDVDP